MEFDPIVHHNQFCPWVNGYVTAAGCAGSSTVTDSFAVCGWQLTLDGLDNLRSLGNIAIQNVQSESAASLYKVCLENFPRPVDYNFVFLSFPFKQPVQYSPFFLVMKCLLLSRKKNGIKTAKK